MDRCVLLTSTPSWVVSPRGDHSGCALVIARRGETTHSGVDVNNTHLSMINPLNNNNGILIQNGNYEELICIQCITWHLSHYNHNEVSMVISGHQVICNHDDIGQWAHMKMPS